MNTYNWPIELDAEQNRLMLQYMAQNQAQAKTATSLLDEGGKAALENIDKRHKANHVWEMLVLAAESSRYG
jgi:ribulose bisphosphate carboxylase small subunit